MGVHDPANVLEPLVKKNMRGKIRGGPQISFHNFALQIRDYQMLGPHFFVCNSARLDDDQPFLAQNPAGIAKRVEHQTVPNQFEIGFQHFLTKLLE